MGEWIVNSFDGVAVLFLVSLGLRLMCGTGLVPCSTWSVGIFFVFWPLLCNRDFFSILWFIFVDGIWLVFGLYLCGVGITVAVAICSLLFFVVHRVLVRYLFSMYFPRLGLLFLFGLFFEKGMDFTYGN